jgi:uncharacterized protein (TIGR03086 family)
MRAMSDVDVRGLHRRAVLDSAQLVERLIAADLDRPTPCPAWSIAELLTHMAAQHRGFAAAARGHGTQREVWQPRLDVDPIADYLSSVHDVLEAFHEDDVLDRRFSLPEISTSVTFSGRVAIGFHLIDEVAHSWDVARASGQAYTPDDELLQAAQRIADRVPNGPERLQPGAAFGPGTVLPDDAPPFDRLLAFLGRSPDWPD